MNRLFAALLSAAILALVPVAAWAQTLTFIGSATGPAQVPLHITVYDAGGVALAPGAVTWGTPPAGVTITPSATGFWFNSNAVRVFSVSATSGIATKALAFNFTAPPLQFTSP